jgi:hypothetical protein
MKKIITSSCYALSRTPLYAITDCSINGVKFSKYSNISRNDEVRSLSTDTKRELLRNGVVSIVPIKAKCVRVIKSFPGFDITSEDIVKYLPYEEERADKWDHKIIFLNDCLEHNGVKIPIDILDAYPTFFEITLVENPEIKEIEYI